MTKQKSLRVDRVIYPDLPTTENGVTTYNLKVIADGNTKTLPCTSQAYKDFFTYRPDGSKYATYTAWLKLNDDGLVYDVTMVLNPADGSFKQELPDGRVIAQSDKLIFERHAGEKEFEPFLIPTMVGVGTVEAIMGALRDSSKLEVSQILLDKYKIHQIAQRDGVEEVTVDLKR
jgi:hypothetical protein